jgi:hypothetical protein
MPIDKTNVIDAIGVNDATGDVTLTIIDHLNWAEDEKRHLALLQEKLNTYLSFIESGELLKSYPNANGRRVLIDVVYKFPLSSQASEFYSQASRIVEGAGIKFHKTLHETN